MSKAPKHQPLGSPQRLPLAANCHGSRAKLQCRWIQNRENVNPAKQTVGRVITSHSSLFAGLRYLCLMPASQIHSLFPVTHIRRKLEGVRTGDSYNLSGFLSAGNSVHSSPVTISCKPKGRRMLFSPALLKEIIKFSERLAGNPGPSSGPMRPAEQASGIWTKKVTRQRGGQGVSVQTRSHRRRGARDGDHPAPRASGCSHRLAGRGEVPAPRPLDPWSPGRSSTYITLQLFLRGGLAKPSRADHFAAAHGARLSGSDRGS